jgi:hypothetical protein
MQFSPPTAIGHVEISSHVCKHLTPPHTPPDIALVIDEAVGPSLFGHILFRTISLLAGPREASTLKPGCKDKRELNPVAFEDEDQIVGYPQSGEDVVEIPLRKEAFLLSLVNDDIFTSQGLPYLHVLRMI